MELGACEWRFVEWLAGQELFGGEQRAGNESGGGCPEFSWQSANCGYLSEHGFVMLEF